MTVCNFFLISAALCGWGCFGLPFRVRYHPSALLQPVVGLLISANLLSFQKRTILLFGCRQNYIQYGGLEGDEEGAGCRRHSQPLKTLADCEMMQPRPSYTTRFISFSKSLIREGMVSITNLLQSLSSHIFHFC